MYPKASLRLLSGVIAMTSAGSALAASVLSPALTEDQLRAKAQKLENRIEELEVQKALNKVTLSGTLINRYEMLDSTSGVPGTDETRNSIRAPMTYMALNADANVTQNLKVYSTLAFSKFWQQENRYEPFSYWSASETGSFGLAGSVARFDRAYMDYSFERFPLSIAAGRMATNNGEPINQLDGFSRMGTYPRLAYNAIFDGIALIYDFSKYLKKNNTFIMRVFMTPFSNVSMTNRTQQMSDVDTNGNGVTVDSSTPQWAALAEYSHTNWKIMEKFDLDYFMYGYYHFYNDGGTLSQQGSPILNGGTVPPANGSGTETANAKNIYLSLQNIGYIGLNFDVNAMFVHSNYTAEGYITMSSSYLVNLNQQFSKLHNLIVGAEYIHTDPNYYLDEYTALNLAPFYQTPNSHGYHMYVSYPLSSHLVFRVGTYQFKTEPCLSLSGVGTLTSTTNETNWHTVYTQARIDF